MDGTTGGDGNGTETHVKCSIMCAINAIRRKTNKGEKEKTEREGKGPVNSLVNYLFNLCARKEIHLGERVPPRNLMVY